MTSLRNAAVIMACLLCSPALAAPATAPLPAGQPAGTQPAALAGTGFAITLGMAGIIAATAILASRSTHDGVTTPTTSATATTGTGP